MRLFLAIELPDAVRAHLQDMQAEWRRQTRVTGVRWIPAANLHLTLKFLGSVTDPSPLVAALQQIPRPGPLRLYTSALQYFPPRGDIRIIAANVDGDIARLRQFVDTIESAIEQHGIPRERRSYRPHITIGRARERLPVRLRKEDPPAIAASPEFVASHFTLFESRLLPSGPEYHPLATFPL